MPPLQDYKISSKIFLSEMGGRITIHSYSTTSNNILLAVPAGRCGIVATQLDCSVRLRLQIQHTRASSSSSSPQTPKSPTTPRSRGRTFQKRKTPRPSPSSPRGSPEVCYLPKPSHGFLGFRSPQLCSRCFV